METQKPCEACGDILAPWPIAKNAVLWKCPNCGHIIRDLEICFADSRESAWGGSGLYDQVRVAITVKRLKRLISLRRSPIHVLEIGFGTGRILKEFIKMDCSVFGVDLGSLGLEIDEVVSKNATLQHGSIEEIELPKCKYDLIYGIHVVEHLQHPVMVFEKCYRALKDNGQIYFLTPNAQSHGLTLFKDSWWNLEDPTHFRFFSKKSIEMMLKKIGFPDPNKNSNMG